MRQSVYNNARISSRSEVQPGTVPSRTEYTLI